MAHTTPSDRLTGELDVRRVHSARILISIGDRSSRRAAKRKRRGRASRCI